VGFETGTAVAAHPYPTGEFPGLIRVPGWGILGEDHVDATGKDGVTQGIEPESIQRGPGCPILELPHHLKGVGVTIAS
jgi:hypothetical protein